nr:TadG family pilus assembly protein [Thioalkalivibrio sp. ALE28]
MGGRHQRGAIGLVAAVTLMAGILALALVIDLGRLFVEQRSLQRIADTAALETALRHTGCAATHTQAASTAQANALANGYSGRLDQESDAVLLGRVVRQDGVRGFEVDERDHPEAVRVVARNEVPTSLVLGGLFGEKTQLAAEAVARRDPVVAVSAGSRLANLSSGEGALLNSLLNEMLGADMELSVGAYEGLAQTSIRLDELAEGLGLIAADARVLDADAVLMSEVLLGDLIDVLVEAVGRENPGAVNASVLRNQLLATGSVTDTLIRLGTFMNVYEGVDGDAVFGARLGVLDTLMAAAMVATGDEAVRLDMELPVALGGIGGADVVAELRVIEPPQIAIGPPGRDDNGEWRTHVTTAQVHLQVETYLAFELLGQAVRTQLGVAVAAAEGEVWVERLSCRESGGTPVEVGIGTRPSAATAGIGHFDEITVTGEPEWPPAWIEIEVQDALGLGSVLPVVGETYRVDLRAEAGLGNAAPESVVFEVEGPEDLPSDSATHSVSLGEALGEALIELEDSLLIELQDEGIPAELAGPLLDAVLEPILVPVVEEIGQGLADPVLRFLGADIGQVEVTLMDLREGGVDLVR